MKTRWKITLAAALVPPLMFWLAGFNFDQRGAGALTCAMITLWLALGVYHVPPPYKDER